MELVVVAAVLGALIAIVVPARRRAASPPPQAAPPPPQEPPPRDWSQERGIVDIDVADLVVDVVNRFVDTAQTKRLELVISVDEDIPTRLWGEAANVHQVLSDLVENAMKFTSAGHVVVTASVIESDVDKYVVRFNVSDSGVGVRDDCQEAIFEPGSGGAGLPTARALVTRMGGGCGVISVAGRGSTFWFTVPLSRAPAAGAPAAGAPDVVGGASLPAPSGRARLGPAEDDLPAAFGGFGAGGDRDGAIDAPCEADDTTEAPCGRDDASEALGESDVAEVRCDSVVVVDGAAAELAAGDRGEDQFAAAEPADGGGSEVEEVDGGSSVPDGGETPPVVEVMRRGSVLLAEDDPVNRRVTMAMLQRTGYRVEVVTDGLEAVRAVSARTFDAVLMDCRMPRMDGLQATTHIRSAEGAERRTPIIALSAANAAVDRSAALAAGMDDYLAKPVTPDELLATVDRWVRVTTARHAQGKSRMRVGRPG